MKIARIIISFFAIGVALYEQAQEKPNLLIVIPAILVFVFGMMPLFNSPKNDETND